ncbi:MAG: glycosyl hydrolase [Flavisolibacter sp.]
MVAYKKSFVLLALCIVTFPGNAQLRKSKAAFWPQQKKEMYPWTRWWWMGNAVDHKNISTLLTTYKQVGFGGVEVTPIYGAIGFENRYIKFLSPQWMDRLKFTVHKAQLLGMGVDMNTGTGWPFGGPQIKTASSSSKLIVQTYSLDAGEMLHEKLVVKDAAQREAGSVLQALTAYNDKGESLSILEKLDSAGQLNWSPILGRWRIFAAFVGKTLQMVKRAAPGGEGLVLNHLSKGPVETYLKRFDDAFLGKLPGIRAFFNDSYEVYGANWSPDLLAEFKQRRGYELGLYIKQLTTNDSSEITARVKCDYRETMSDMLLNNFTATWTNWAHGYKKFSKNQAHGSPGNLLDLYSTVDIPETETFFGTSYFPIPGLRRDSTDVVTPNPNPIIFKFATSAAHNKGNPLASSETFVWLTEHFRTSLSQCKPEVEQLFLAGVNHVFYHGTTYSPKDVPFPGWLFYASVNFVPSNSLWPHLNGLNQYVARCQSVLQSGRPDNELLLYWPVYDIWSSTLGMEMQLSMHNLSDWLTPTAFTKLATTLQQAGYSTDFVSDKMITQSQVKKGNIQTAPSAAAHKVLIVPACKYMPVETLQKIIQLASKGATVILQQMPEDVPGLYDVKKRRSVFQSLLYHLSFNNADSIKLKKIGSGQILLSDNIQKALELIKIYREQLTDIGLKFIRRSHKNGKYYYIVNHTNKTINEYIPLNVKTSSIAILDPQNSSYGIAATKIKNRKTYVRVQMQPGEALILETFKSSIQHAKPWEYLDSTGTPIEITGNWCLHFTKGGPVLPPDKNLTHLTSWTQLKDSNAIAFSGSGEYTNNFNMLAKNAREYILKLDKVYETAHVWINGKDVGILWSFPFEARIGRFLKRGRNIIKIEVANLMANRIRDMDKKGTLWRNYHEINFVNINYKPFDASGWEPQVSGLLGPVKIIPVK